MERFIADRLVRMRMQKRLEESRLKEAYEDLSQEELIDKAKSGDSKAFEKLLSDNEDLIRMASNKYFLKSGDREDTRQIANIAFWDAVNKYDTKSNGDFRAFAGMIIKRKFSDEIRKENTDRRVLNISSQSMEDPVASDGEGGEATVGDTLPDKGLNPEERYLGKEGAKSLIRYMKDNLSAQEMKAIKLYIKGMKVSKISEVTGVPYKSVENAIRRVKGKIMDYMRSERQTESKKLEESENIFSDEEKEVLGSVIGKIEIQESIQESLGLRRVNESHKWADVLYDAEVECSDIKTSIGVDGESRDELLRRLVSVEDTLRGMEEDETVTDDQWDRAEDILSAVSKLKDRLSTGNEDEIDPYVATGHHRSDFQ